ncbi:response regulator transcription factor [Sphingobacterium endophyticum]|uniref:response regulator transcription factor n=1 Tax=Sphingobacterium endophyticum TaxID=2546448 RepID=UPI0012E1836A|nr:response regulator transcription factor [Sphingobacterium endophyticum]
MENKVLLVEDDNDFGAMLQQYLEYSNMQVEWIDDPRKMLDRLDSLSLYDIAILDVMLPHMNGFKLAELLISIRPKLPILFLTAKDQKIDKLTGLKIGADDYMTKPCDPEELTLRLHNIIKRTKTQPALQQVIPLGTYTFDQEKMLLLHPQSGSVQLTERESKLLSYLIQHKHQLIAREDVLMEVWQSNDFFAGRSMDVFISRLRKYLQQDKNLSIQSLRGIGFKVDL